MSCVFSLQTAILRSQLEESNLQSDKYKEELESLAARFSSGQEELADARASLAKREDEVLYLEQIVASHHSKPSRYMQGSLHFCRY